MHPPNVKKVFVRSGIRFDYLIADKDDEFFYELCKHHISGQLKVAPEHISDVVLSKLGKPKNAVYERFVEKYKRINKTVLTTQLCVLAVGGILGNLVFLLGEPLMGLYTDSAVVVEAGIKRFSVVCTTYALCGMMDVMVGALRGLGYSVMPMIVSLLGACAFRLVWISLLFRSEAFHTIETIYYTYPISWTLTLAIHLICYLVVRKKSFEKMMAA